MFLKVVSLIITLPSVYLVYLSTPYSIGLTMLLFIYMTGICNNTNCGVVCPLMVNFIQSLAI